MMKVELLQTHTHKGVIHPAGTCLELDEAPARWLIGLKVAKVVNPDKKPAVKTGNANTTGEQ